MIRARSGQTVAGVRGFEDAAGMRLIGHCCRRQRGEIYREREDQKQRGSQAAHFLFKSEPADQLDENRRGDVRKGTRVGYIIPAQQSQRAFGDFISLISSSRRAR